MTILHVRRVNRTNLADDIKPAAQIVRDVMHRAEEGIAQIKDTQYK